MRGQEVSCEANVNIELKNLEIVQSCQNQSEGITAAEAATAEAS